MLLLLVAAYSGNAPLIASRRRIPRFISGLIDDPLSMRMLGNRRYALSAAAIALVVSGLVGSDFLPVFPTALGFAALMVLSAVDPMAGFAAGLATLIGVVLGGGATSADEWRAAIVIAVSYSLAPMLAAAIARRVRRSTAASITGVAAVAVYYIVAFAAVKVVGALLRAELSIDSAAVWLLMPAVVAFAARWTIDQQYERNHRRDLGLRRMDVTFGLVPVGLAVLSFVVLSEVLLDEESLFALLMLGVIIGLRQIRLPLRGVTRPPASRTR